jgi:hypothetical protein
MADLSQTQHLIAAHITAETDHERLFHLEDWGLVDEAAVFDAIVPVEDALIAICRARPTEQADIDLRRRYLTDHLAEAIYADRARAQRVIVALIDDVETGSDGGTEPPRPVGGAG